MALYPLLSKAVRALASVDDGAFALDGVGFNGGDTKFGNQVAAMPPEAWDAQTAHDVWAMLSKYREQLSRHGVDYNAIPEPILINASTNATRGVTGVDVRDGKVVVFIPWGVPIYCKGPLHAEFNRDIKAWVVGVDKYGSVLTWAKRYEVTVSDRAKALLDVVPQDKAPMYAGEVLLERGEIVIKFDYNTVVLDAVRMIPGRVWHAEDKTWRVPKEMVMPVKHLAEEHKFFMTEDIKNLHGEEISTAPHVSVMKESFALRFTYNAQMVSQVRQMPGSLWDPKSRVWLVPVEAADEVIKFIEQHDAEVASSAQVLIDDSHALQEIIEASAAHDADITIDGFGDETYQLYPFQRAGVSYAMRALGYNYNFGAWLPGGPIVGGVMIGDEQGLGKGNVHGSKVLTPKGWTNIENLSVGDDVIGSNGHATKVTGVFPRGEMDAFTVGFNDGSSVDVSGDHLWAVQHAVNWRRHPEKWHVFETTDLADKLTDSTGNLIWKIPIVKPVHFEDGETLPVDPYLFGLLLGDGSLSGAVVGISSMDDFIVDEVRKRVPDDLTVAHNSGCNYRITSDRAGSPNSLRRTLDSLGMRCGSLNKFIPEKYLRASVNDRLALLRGLMDSDGSAGADGTNEFSSVSKELADGVAELAQSLGGVVRRNTKQPRGQRVNGGAYYLSYRVNVKMTVCPFLLPRKADAWKAPTKYPPSRNIKSITPRGRAQVTCIAVEADDHLYVTEHYLVTHNTPQGLAVLKAANAFPAVVVVPSSLKINWKREAERWIPGIKVQVISGTQGTLDSGLFEPPDLYVINYDVLVHWTDKFPPLQGMILDESHYIKNGSAIRTKACVRLSDRVVEGGVRLCMSGTPVVNRPNELITQLRVIGRLEEFGGPKGFKSSYGTSSGRALASLNRKLRSSCYVRRRKDDVLKELPPKQWSQIYVEGDREIMAEYREAEADIIRYLAELAREFALASGATTAQAQDEAWKKALKARSAEQLVAIGTLKQIAARAKMASAREWVENFLDGDKKLIVFGWHRATVDNIAENFSGGVKIQGGQSMDVRQSYVDKFQNEDDQKVISCQIKAAGVGLTLTAASDVLFLEQGWTPGEMDQAVDRAHRIGQTDSVTGWVMMCANTIDEDIAALIDAKRVVVNRVTDGSAEDDEEMGSQDIGGDLLVMLAERGLAQAS